VHHHDALGGAVGDQLGQLGERADLADPVEEVQVRRVEAPAVGECSLGLLVARLYHRRHQ
jgi:hypothetical protein